MKHPVKRENARNTCVGKGDNSQRESDLRKITALAKEHSVLAQHWDTQAGPGEPAGKQNPDIPRTMSLLQLPCEAPFHQALQSFKAWLVHVHTRRTADPEHKGNWQSACNITLMQPKTTRQSLIPIFHYNIQVGKNCVLQIWVEALSRTARRLLP